MKDKFAPAIIDSNGDEFTPKGWMWVLAFALRGCEWAVKEASKPEFRKKILEDKMLKMIEWNEKEVDKKLKRIEELRKELGILKQDV